jgi:hypothetical protein
MAIRRNRKLTVPESLLRTALLPAEPVSPDKRRLYRSGSIFAYQESDGLPDCSQSLYAEASVNIPHVVTALLVPESMFAFLP